MGLFDAVKGALGQVEAAAVPALINAALAKTNLGDLKWVDHSASARRIRAAGSALAGERPKSLCHR